MELISFDMQYGDCCLQMVFDFFTYHQELLETPKDKRFSRKDAESVLQKWSKKKEFQLIFEEDILGFCLFKEEDDVLWIEDIYIREEYRGKGYGKRLMEVIDQKVLEEGKDSLFVNVIPRNTSAISFYRACGFTNLNMIELRKNYDPQQNKDKKVTLLGLEYYY